MFPSLDNGEYKHACRRMRDREERERDNERERDGGGESEKKEGEINSLIKT